MDPYRLYNGLDENYVSLEAEGVEEGPLPPPFPSRVRAFVYACAVTAEAESGASRR